MRRAANVSSQMMSVKGAAEVLFAAGGKNVLNEAAQQGVREVVEKATSQAITELGHITMKELTEGISTALSTTVVSEITKTVGETVTREAAKAAGREVVKGVGRATALGFVVDGAFGAAESSIAYAKGDMTLKEVSIHTAKEAGTGAVASGAGLMLAAGVVALTGPVSVPALTIIAGGGAIVTKLGLNQVM
jgi:hypothetical protein